MIIKLFEIVRIAGVTLAFFLGYQTGYAGTEYDPVAQLHLMIPMTIFFIAGLSGIEGLFFGDEAARSKGFESGSNYQRQSAIALLSYTVISILIWALNWGLKAELTVFFCFMFFFFFSAVNHSVQAIANRNFKFTNVNRPFLVILLIAGFYSPVVAVLKLL
ncbi:MAG: hypothetical protein KKD74_14410 [Bacteroidetes bacterium]|nr:hypothetical protein [Bacteroidales bacterium]MBU1011325.1 hypothetical protein [Bacteroidota bacterium]